MTRNQNARVGFRLFQALGRKLWPAGAFAALLLALGVLWLGAATVARAVAADPANDPAIGGAFNGSWETIAGDTGTRFTVTLKQTGNTVTGSYASANGKVTGTIYDGLGVGRSLAFKWKQPDGYEGTGEFTFDEDGKAFKGTSTGLKPRQFTHSWNSIRKPPPSLFAGSWEMISNSTMAKSGLKLIQTEDKVTGFFTPGNGKISDGVVEGRKLTFKWTQDGGLSGSGEFGMSADGKTVSSKMSRTADPNANPIEATLKRQAPEFTGSWDWILDGFTPSVLTLSQGGNKVNGSFTAVDGKLEGTADDGLLVFKWTKPDGASGAGRLEFSPDGEGLKGNFSGAGGAFAPITATRRPAAFAGKWLMRFNAPQPFVVTLQQEGDNLSGAFKGGNSQVKDEEGQILNGKVLGNIAYFSWTRNGGRAGTGWIEMNTRSAFSGEFRDGDGTKIPCKASKL